MLSTLSLITLIASVTPNYKSIMNAVCRYEFCASSVLEGWNGIDSIPCVTLIHLSEKKTHIPRGIDRKTMVAIYQLVWDTYSKVCTESGLPFVPCMKGLTTLLLKRRTA